MGNIKGAIIINAFSRHNTKHRVDRLSSQLQLLGSSVDVIINDNYLCRTEGGKTTSNLSQYDYCVFLDKDKYLLKALELDGVPTFNSYDAITTCDDKMLTYMALNDCNIPMPLTLAAPLCYTQDSTIPDVQIESIENALSYPVVIKQCYGSLGKQVFLAHNRSQLTTLLEEVKLKPHIIQQYISASYGKDIRVIVVGNKVLGCMLRQSNNDFRSNVAQGGTATSYPLTDEIEQLALTIAKKLKLHYCGLDLLVGDDGLLLCEVNSNAFFDAFESATNINVAGQYAQHIIETITK